MRRSMLGAAVMCALCWSPASAAAAIDATIELSANGVLLTENPDPARPNQVPILGFGEGVSVPYDHASGLPTGRRQHKPIYVTKSIDKATPYLYKAVSNDELVQAVVRFYDPATGAEYFRITMTDCIVTSISGSGSDGGDRPTESISLSFQQIQWEDVSSGNTHSDTWSSGAP